MLGIELRGSDSPYVDRVWRSHSNGVERMMSVATSTWELVVWSERGRVNVAVRGPETKASAADVPEDSESFGIIFSYGTALSHLPAARLVNAEVESPHVTASAFAMRGEQWRLPRFDDAEELVTQLVRSGALVRDPLVGEAVHGGSPSVGIRTVQRRVAASTGLTQGAIRRIERAREAALLLGQGVPALSVVHRLGYHDQPHLARSLRRFIGRTATQLRQAEGVEPLSLLYKTGP